VDAALAEDVGPGDVTSLATVPEGLRAEAEITVKQEGIVCGLPVARLVFERVDPAIAFEADARDGDAVRPGVVVARLSGPARSLLTGERTALNFLQHLSGIATATGRAAALLAGTGIRLLDTRKTVPGLRGLAKYAVRCGGGTNHRMGLHDMILIKENHVAAAGGITPAVRAARERYPGLPLEVEVTNEAELREALAAGPDRILLDNFTPDRLDAALALVDAARPRPEIELSGGITAETLRDFARPGVDFISSGAITHSAPALDLSMEIRTVGGRP
jgi:nicotinate-nucleotide pyrophosphorylase (carboxylating)